MGNRVFSALLALTLVCGTYAGFSQTDSAARYRADVEMVVLTFLATDDKGNAARGLTPEDVRIFEDGIPQKIAAFSEGSRVFGQTKSADGTSVFILFDTSNRMYKTFPYVYDAISEFVRRLDSADAVAVYTFSRNLFRAAPLTPDHVLARNGLNNAVAGDDTALFNCLLLTLRDAAAVPGRKAIVVFSNGPDNASAVSPYDVGRLAENEGIPIYLISSNVPEENHVTMGALKTLTQRTGGKLIRANNWREQSAAFRSIREEIESSYTVCYYPAPNDNMGFRNIKLEIQTAAGKTYHVRTRPGYRFHERGRATNSP